VSVTPSGDRHERTTGRSGGRSDLQQFGFLVLEELVDLRRVLRGGVVQFLLRAPHLVLAALAVLDELVEGLLGLAADRADGDLGVLALVLATLM